MTSTQSMFAPRSGWGWGIVLAVLLLSLPVVATPTSVSADEPRLLLGTTVGLARSGLLDALLPAFERQTGRTVTTVAVSAPQALALAARGELDLLLVDATDDEVAYVAAGHAIDRRLVMHADEVVVGPRDDPARAREAIGPADALRRIAASTSGWVSRGDNSGLYQLERRLWREAGLDPVGQPWYDQLGQGMVPTLTAATERQAYALADRLTFLERRDLLDLAVVVEGAPDLLRLYHVLVVNPARGAWIDEAGARALAEYLGSPEAQAMIRRFGEERFGRPIFVPDAGRTEQELRPARRPAA
jgi:tungstate transport system substrate-binding protein